MVCSHGRLPAEGDRTRKSVQGAVGSLKGWAVAGNRRCTTAPRLIEVNAARATGTRLQASPMAKGAG